MGGVFFLITLVMVYKGLKTAPFFTGCLAFAFLVAALTVPGNLRGIHERWMNFAEVIGRFNAKLVIGFVYMVFFSLMRFVFWAIRKDPMNRNFDPSVGTYWIDKEPDSDTDRYFRQY